MTRRNLPSKLFSTLALLAFSAMLAAPTVADIMIDPTSDTIQFGGMTSHKPGLKLRMTQAVSDMVKENLLQYGVAYMNWDLKIPEEGKYEVRSFPVYTDFYYYDMVYDPFKIDISNAALNFTHMAIDEKAVVYMELPVIKSWKVMFEYYYKLLFMGHRGKMEIDFYDTSAIITTELKATTDGHLYPHLHDFQMNIEHSRLYHEDAFAQFFYRQFFDLSKYIIQSAYNMFGAGIINKNLYTYTKSALNDQIYEFPLEINQLGKNGTFNLNWRMTADPKIHNHELDFSIFFDIGPEQSRCLVPSDQHNYYFQDNYKSKYMQFVMSDRVPNCLMEAMERQDWFKYQIDTKFMVEHFGTHRVPINADLLKHAYPILSETYGLDQELELEVELRMPRVTFGTTERDMFFTTTLKMGVKLAGDLNYIIYDEIDVYMEGDMSVDQEVLIGNVQSLTATKAKLSDTARTKPIYDTLDITEEQYAAFWTYVEGSCQRWQDFYNNKVLSTGIPLPYWNLEFLTKFTFHPHAMIVVTDIFYNNMDGIVAEDE